jgi:Rieske Fe-S protein
VEPHGEETPHVPPPTLWPVGFAIGIAVLLVGLIVNPLWVAPVGAAIAIVFGFLWIRDLTRGVREPPPAVEPEAREPIASEPALPAQAGGPALPPAEPGEAFPRNKFLEGATLGLGAVIGGVITLPVLGFAVGPAFLKQGHPDVDLGPISNFPEGKFVVATFMENPAQGEVSRRTAYVRNNGTVQNTPSFTVISNRCAHLGCPVQPNGLLFTDQEKTVKTRNGEVRLIPSLPAGFGCPCHGGQYDTEGNRTAGPPVRALDRYDFLIKNGNLLLGTTYSVGKVTGAGASARITRYTLTGPGQHVDGPEWLFYPIQPPQ